MLPLTPTPQSRLLPLIVMAFGLTIPRVMVGAEDEEKVSDDDLQMDGVFNSSLPGTEKKHRLKLLFRPHFGDVHRKDHLRVPLALRYGLSDLWEISAGMEGYFSHGLGDVAWMEAAGFSNVMMSTKYRFGRRLWSYWDMGVGMDYRMPVSSPPADVSDGLRHFGYHFSFSRELTSKPGWRVFWNVGVDEVARTDRPVHLEENELGDDSMNVNGGVVWQRVNHSYTLEMSYATTRLNGTTERDLYTIRPGVIWKLPKRYTFNAKGDWFLGVSTPVAHGRDGTEFGVSAKLRISFNFKDWWRRHFPKKSE